jgi:antitoxin (DNA-binding transcriptional repressor) of toxin-antitoxin stability system
MERSRRRGDFLKRLSIRDTRQSLSRLDELLRDDGEVTITRRGEAIARIVRIGERKPIPSHRDLREKMARMKRGSEELVRNDRDGR